MTYNNVFWNLSVAIQTWQQNKKPALSWFSVNFYYDTSTLMDVAAYM